jgi:hypothetical protein
MIIESAFYKLPELLSSGSAGGDSFESTVVHFLSLALHMELNARNIPCPYDHICPEKPYPTLRRVSHKLKADLYLNLSGALPIGPITECYGVRSSNWIEAKAYLGSTRHDSIPPKVVNAGALVRDMIRLSLLPEELQGGIRQNGRYLLVVAANEPSESLSFNNRPWLTKLFAEGEAEITIDVGSERESFQRAVGPGFVGLSPVVLELKTHTLVFRPYKVEVSPLFWGYLVRIGDFHVTLPTGEVLYTDSEGDHWDSARIAGLDQARDRTLELMR